MNTKQDYLLLVEDDPDILKLLETTLTKMPDGVGTNVYGNSLHISGFSDSPKDA